MPVESYASGPGCLVSPKLPWTPFRAYYERLLAPPSSKRRAVALGHLSSKLITVLWHCMTNHQPYDAQRLATDMHLPLQATG